MSWNDDWVDEDEPVSIEFKQIKARTDLAILVVIDNEEHRLPLSQVEDLAMNENGPFDKSGSCVIPQWLADEKGLT